MSDAYRRAGGVLRWVAAGALVLLSLVGIAMAFPDFVARHVVPVFLYLPGRVPEAASSPAAAGLGHGREVSLETSDGVTLHAWWVPPLSGGAGASPDGADRSSAGSEPGGRRRGGSPAVDRPAADDAPGCGAVVFFHGNAGTLVDRASIAEKFSRRGFGALLVDYRGYGLSGGSPGEEGLYRDARAGYRHVVEELGYPERRVAVAGHSLGSAVAADLAAEASPAAVVLTGAFRTMPELARHAYPYFPDPLFRSWTTNRFDVQRKIPRLDAPILVARGGLDTLVPRAQTRAVFEALDGPRRWYEAPAAGHNDLWDHDGFWRETTAFLAEALDCPGPEG